MFSYLGASRIYILDKTQSLLWYVEQPLYMKRRKRLPVWDYQYLSDGIYATCADKPKYIWKVFSPLERIEMKFRQLCTVEYSESELGEYEACRAGPNPPLSIEPEGENHADGE